MKLIFIASPFRATTDWQRAENVRAAERMALAVWKLGAVAVCPQANSQHFHGEMPDDVFLDGYLALLKRCDAVLVGAMSVGVEREVELAKECSLPIYRDINGLEAWLRREEVPLFA